MRARCRNPLTPVGPADGLKLGSADARDLGALIVLDRVCFGARAWPHPQWREILAERSWRVTVARRSGEIAAVSVLLSGVPRAHLVSLAVAPAWRRRGVGRLLLRDAVHAASAAGARWLLLEVDGDNRDALRLYRADGFAVSRRFREDGRARLEMVRRISARCGRHTLAIMPSA